MDDTLRDETEDNILETASGRQDIIDRIKSKPAKAATAKSVGGDEGNAIKKKFDELKAAAGDGGDSDEDLSECPIDEGVWVKFLRPSSNFVTEPPAKKKVKGDEQDAELKIKAFMVYGNMSNGSLDDVLVWNGQTKVITLAYSLPAPYLWNLIKSSCSTYRGKSGVKGRSSRRSGSEGRLLRTFLGSLEGPEVYRWSREWAPAQVSFFWCPVIYPYYNRIFDISLGSARRVSSAVSN